MSTEAPKPEKRADFVSIASSHITGPVNMKPFKHAFHRIMGRNRTEDKSMLTGVFYIISATFDGKKYFSIGSTFSPATTFAQREKYMPNDLPSYDGVVIVVGLSELLETLVRLYLPSRSAVDANWHWYTDIETEIAALIDAFEENSHFRRSPCLEMANVKPLTITFRFIHDGNALPMLGDCMSLFRIKDKDGNFVHLTAQSFNWTNAELLANNGSILSTPDSEKAIVNFLTPGRSVKKVPPPTAAAAAAAAAMSAPKKQKNKRWAKRSENHQKDATNAEASPPTPTSATSTPQQNGEKK